MIWERSRTTTITVNKKTHEKLVYLKYGIGARNMAETVEYILNKYIEYLRVREKLEEMGLWDKVWNEINKEL